MGFFCPRDENDPSKNFSGVDNVNIGTVDVEVFIGRSQGRHASIHRSGSLLLLLRVIGAAGVGLLNSWTWCTRRACSDVRVNGLCSLGKAAGRPRRDGLRENPVLT
jgi:hypothetical protein